MPAASSPEAPAKALLLQQAATKSIPLGGHGTPSNDSHPSIPDRAVEHVSVAFRCMWLSSMPRFS